MAWVVGMIYMGFHHPALRVAHGYHPVTLAAKRAFLIKIFFIGSYWTVALLILMVVVVLAWLDFREITRYYLLARRSVWNDMAKDSERHNDTPPQPH
ncbi:MAG: hypothetical protein M1330_05070 [Armatimonadetes bacterium]|nr:hypothetical protein [Armatimonadota bacterium]